MDPALLTIVKQEILDTTEFETLSTDDLKPCLSPSPPEIGSRNSAFQPYKPLTILTNLQRGNVKTLARDVVPQLPLTFQEQAAKGTLTKADINDSNVNSVDTEGYSALIWASFHGKAPMVKLLVENGAEINLQGPEGQNALMFAASKGHDDIVVYLLSKEAELEAEDDFGNTALIHAANLNQSQCVHELLIRGASMTKYNYIGDNAFEIAFTKGNKAAQYMMEMHLKRILEADSDVES